MDHTNDRNLDVIELRDMDLSLSGGGDLFDHGISDQRYGDHILGSLSVLVNINIVHLRQTNSMLNSL